MPVLAAWMHPGRFLLCWESEDGIEDDVGDGQFIGRACLEENRPLLLHFPAPWAPIIQGQVAESLPTLAFLYAISNIYTNEIYHYIQHLHEILLESSLMLGLT